jgi:hypothetical protein
MVVRRFRLREDGGGFFYAISGRLGAFQVFFPVRSSAPAVLDILWSSHQTPLG